MRQPIALALAVLSLAAGGCAPRMKVAASLEDGAEEWPVTAGDQVGWEAQVSFGPWKVVAARAAGWSLDVLGIAGKAAAAARPHGLKIEGPAGTVEAECLDQRLTAAAPFGVEVDLEKVGGTLALACAFRPSGSSGWTGAWSLVLRATGQPTQAYEGELRDARGVSFSVRAVHRLDSGVLLGGPPQGYAIDRVGTAAAAVERRAPSRVLVSRRESERAALAAASAALLLFQPAE